MLDKEVRGQLALLWSFLPKADDTYRCVGRSIAASRWGALLWLTETVFPELSRSDRPAGIFQLNESRRRLPLEPARVAQAISRLLL
jgi:hypothetical protein